MSIPATQKLDYVWNHNLGVIPTRMQWMAANSANPTWVMLMDPHSRSEVWTSPEQTWLSANQVFWSKVGADYVVWCDTNANPCPAGVTASTSGYMRLLLWK